MIKNYKFRDIMIYTVFEIRRLQLVVMWTTKLKKLVVHTQIQSSKAWRIKTIAKIYKYEALFKETLMRKYLKIPHTG